MAELTRIGNIYGEDRGTGFAGNVWDKEGISPTITTMQGGGREPMIIEEPKKVDFGDGEVFVMPTEKGAIINTEQDGLSHTIKAQYFKTSLAKFARTGTTFGATGVVEKENTIVAMRGRNPENPTSRKAGLTTEQRLEPNNEGMANTLTTVQKDNLLLETIKIKQATKEGEIECKVGGCYDASYPDSKTRRGRVQEGGDVTPTITAQGGENINFVETRYRIRKLTPKECWRLMGYSDEDFEKAAKVESNTQLYKQAGNAIVKQVLMAIFMQMNIQNIKMWNEQQKVTN